MALSGTCALLRHHSLSAEWAETWAILTLDLEALLSDAFYDQDGTKQHAFRCWVMRRRHAIRELCVEWPAYVPLEGSLWMMPLISSIVATLADASLTSLRYIFTCEVPWMDTLVPMGPAALQELHIQSCHLSVVPPALATLACSLTSLSIGLCEGFAGHVGPPLGLGKALACLTGLQHLRLDCATSASVLDGISQLTRLSSLVVTGGGFVMLPRCLSALRGLASLELTDSLLHSVPEVIKHFTGLRTLLLGGNRLGLNLLDSVDPGAPQGVPLALSALRCLELLSLDRSAYLREMPQAFLNLPRLTRLMLGGGLSILAPGPYLGNLQELSIRQCWCSQQPRSLDALAGATSLRRLSLNHSGVGLELPDAIVQRAGLTYLDFGGITMSRLPEGPYTASVEELHLDSCAVRPGTLITSLPSLPYLSRLNWQGNHKLGIAAARHLLARAPRLRVLWMEEHCLTKPARQALQVAEVAVVDTTYHPF
ncbi:hypothetical protein D9Q98_007952 [Chlorella vulgaris]|uniref:Uncharacterized protein n=1 Tax=Chlorella vulgaris TaxID=3077 RepID=A0A9D4YTW0_CHLVU|nr:hypothetical protein D9Q98_007952 [Chlorella vulgaris]